MQISSDMLFLSGEPAVIIRKGRIFQANAAAISVLGEGCIGKTVRSVFGAAITESQASVFVCTAAEKGERFTVRVMKNEGVQTIFFSRSELPGELVSDTFIYSMRNQLMNFGFSIDLLRRHARDAKDDSALRQLALLMRSCYLMRHNVSNIAVLYSIRNNTIVLNFRPFDLREMVSALTESVAPFFPGTPIKLMPGAPIDVIADPAVVELIMLNLISNCILHADGLTRININLSCSEHTVNISVDDDGCGIAADKLFLVFERYRHSFLRSELGSGSGLGLTVVRELAHIHKGTLMLESRETFGTTVRVSLSRNNFPLLGNTNEPWTPSTTQMLLQLAEALPPERFMDIT